MDTPEAMKPQAVAYARHVLAAFDVLPSEIGLLEPFAESRGSLARQRRREARTQRRAPGDFAAEIAGIEARCTRMNRIDHHVTP